MTDAFRTQPSKQGLTLIEVMMAVAILSVGMVILLVSASRCLAVIKGAQVYQDARTLLAQVELENPLVLEEDLSEGVDSGYFRGDFSNYKWTRELRLATEDEEDGLYIVTTRIHWSDRNRARYEEVVTYYYSPPEEEDLR